MELFPAIMEGLRANDKGDVLVVAGGIIPEEDRAALAKMGIGGIFSPGASLQEIVSFIRGEVSKAQGISVAEP